MDAAHTPLQLANGLLPDIAAVDVVAVIDTRVVHLCIPERLATGLKLDQLGSRTLTLADGSTRVAPYVGPVMVSGADRRCFVGAIVLGDEVILGLIPIEDMDVLIDQRIQQLVPNPGNARFVQLPGET